MACSLPFLKGLKYYHYTLDKNSDPYKADDEQFNNALTVHPVSEPEQMYRLHKHFTQLELQRTYNEIAKLQVSRFPDKSSTFSTSAIKSLLVDSPGPVAVDHLHEVSAL